MKFWYGILILLIHYTAMNIFGPTITLLKRKLLSSVLNKWDSWQFESARFQKRANYIKVEEWLQSLHGKPIVSDVFVKNRLVEISQQGAKRQKSLKWLSESFKPLLGLSLLSGISLILIIALKPHTSELSYNGVLGVTLGLTFLFLLIAGLLERKFNNLSRERIERPIDHYVHKKHLEHFSKIHQTLLFVQSNEISLFVCEADGEVKKVVNRYWTKDNWEIGIFLDLEGRKSISLKGTPPSGDFLLLKSDLDSLNISEPLKKTSPKKRNRNQRTDIGLQIDALKDTANIRKLIKLIYRKYPKDAEGIRKKITKGQSARLKALEYISLHPKFWRELRKEDVTIDSTTNHKHRRELLNIFSEIARNRSTLNEPGIDLMKEFIEHEDRTFEVWLEKLGWKIYG